MEVMEMAVRNRKKTVRITSGIRPEEYGATPLLDLLAWQPCYDELVRRIHPLGLHCPCGSPQGLSVSNGRTRAGIPVRRCRNCGATYTVLTGTPFSGTKLGARRLVLFMRMWHAGSPAGEIGQAVGLHRNSVNQMMANLVLHRKYNRAGQDDI
jgi:transposase-like protein